MLIECTNLHLPWDALRLSVFVLFFPFDFHFDMDHVSEPNT